MCPLLHSYSIAKEFQGVSATMKPEGVSDAQYHETVLTENPSYGRLPSAAAVQVEDDNDYDEIIPPSRN